jgi:two-component system, cell cycle response regulator DivK
MRTIAIVEDAEDNRDLIYFMLRDEFNVTRYSDGEEALRGIGAITPDLILLDIWLPGLDGVEVLKRLRADPATARIPVVALTADAMSGGRDKYLADGFDAYASKPIIDIKEFSAMLYRLLGDVD